MKTRLTLNWQIDHHQLDPVLFTLLDGIERFGSLQQATKHAKVSYRFAWGLLNKWQQQLGEPLVILERGRGANLSKVGQHLLDADKTLHARLSPELTEFSSQFERDMSALLSIESEHSRTVFASHGLAISALRDVMHQTFSSRLDVHFHGSLESLRALKNQQCDIAGFHIPEGNLAKQLAPHYLNLINPKTHQLLYVVKRNQGLLVAKGNPKRIQTIEDLTQNGVEFINRQTDSGTRLLFDQLLTQNTITSAQIQGYHSEEFTHMAVAAMIASGAADVGFGIAPMAKKFNLDFIPLVWEHYCLALPKALSENPLTAEIIAVLQGDVYRQQLALFDGYDVSHSGDWVDFDSIIG